MSNDINLDNKIITAAKWSTVTEIIAKIISPITNMVLARLLAPEAFGVIATITMIITFADMLTDAGFQKFLIQHEFKSEKEKYNNANVAFITNLVVSILLWVLISIYSDHIAILVGNPGLGIVISIACIQLPLTAFSSIQMGLFRREFNFKILFIVRVISISIPIVVTIPLAILGFSYWSLIIGSISMHLSNALILTIKSKWKPNLYFDFKVLKQMASFSLWSLIESISIWLTTWIDTLIIGTLLNEHLLGIYKTSTTMVNTMMSLITASIVPVLFSALSRLQDSNEKFNKTYFNIQRAVSILVFPLGIGVYLYSDFATHILLGSQWAEASKVIGIWALTSSIMIVFGHFCSEAYRAKGKPKLSFIAQLLHLVVLVPACLISSKYGFWALVYTRSWIRMEFVLVHFILMQKVIGISIAKTIKNVYYPALSAIVMGIIGLNLQKIAIGLIWEIISIISCAIFYFAIICLAPNMRQQIKVILNKLVVNRS